MAKNELTEDAGELDEFPSHSIRTIVLDKIRQLLAANDWTQSEAARLCGLTQPRISDLRRGNTGRFSLDALVDIAAVLARHSKPSKGSSMQCSVEDELHRLAESFAKENGRPIQAVYTAATNGSTTARGGKIIGTSELYLGDERVALVGDTVRYPDGSEARIISGAGIASVIHGRPAALVGSPLDNGDYITGPVNYAFMITQYADEPPIEGLLDPDYVPKPYQGEQHG